MKLTLVEKKDEAKGTKSFFFKPEKEVSWMAGQYYYYTLPKLNYPDGRGATRHITISSSPTEGGLLRLTTRVRDESGFKKTLDELPIGAVVDGEGPTGTFILDEKNKDINVFLAGGIGVTPFRSMIKYATDKKLNIPLYLIYSNSVPEEIAFREEFEGLATANPNFKVAMTVSKPEESKEKWNGTVGRIDENLIKTLLGGWGLDVNGVVFWICGPPPMVDAMEDVLGKMGISSSKVLSEKFTGY
ncbi:MAG TPA: FAD-dependent oxidoreductase [Patescibacteria group bacterium]|nr:FAD-dependent oxidoreductase [Patescibacteria group bacterium]